MKALQTTLIIITILSLSFSNAFAQKEKIYKASPFQISLLSPIGSNGLDSDDYVNNLSWNIIWGVSAGLNGIEIGGIGNTETDFVRGVQLAGVFNMVGKTVEGIQISGLINIVGGEVRGLQIADFGNFNGDDTNGVQYAGFMNVVNGKFRGIQSAGFMNISNKGLKGIQLSGFGNYNGKQTKGVALAGFMNQTETLKGLAVGGFMNTAENNKGVQVAGFMNIAESSKGMQLGGFMNVAESSKGLQWSGFMNIAEHIRGIQWSGFMNIAKKVNGVQIGFVNIADEYESGIPIGLLSFVKDGFQDIEIGYSPALSMVASYKTGIDKFYNIISLGTQFTTPDVRWAIGYGFGTRFNMGSYLTGSMELISYSIHESYEYVEHHTHGKRHKDINQLTQILITLEGKVAGSMKWFAGPTFNFHESSDFFNSNNPKSDFAPWSVYQGVNGKTSLTMWPGFRVGIRL